LLDKDAATTQRALARKHHFSPPINAQSPPPKIPQAFMSL